MTEKQPDLTDINALAIEACDMWQEHLSSFSKDPSMRAELTRFLEPQRRLFADWAAMMQQGGSHGPTSAKESAAGAEATDDDSSGPTDRADAAGKETTTATAAPSGVAASGDDPFRVAQLALRLAELEKRVAKLESVAASASR